MLFRWSTPFLFLWDMLSDGQPGSFHKTVIKLGTECCRPWPRHHTDITRHTHEPSLKQHQNEGIGYSIFMRVHILQSYVSPPAPSSFSPMNIKNSQLPKDHQSVPQPLLICMFDGRRGEVRVLTCHCWFQGSKAFYHVNLYRFGMCGMCYCHTTAYLHRTVSLFIGCHGAV